MPLLELKGIDKYYRRGGWFGHCERVPVLKQVSLNIEDGACLGLLGRSGSGKSTLSRIALGLEPPDAGRVRFMGCDPARQNGTVAKQLRKEMQVVFQNSLGSVNPRMTAGEVIAEPICNFESPTRAQLTSRIGSLLEMVGLQFSDARKLPHQFSGGQLQRVCIARAIALKPKLIILDEPVSSLDMVVQARILDLLAGIRQELGTSYLFISHDIRAVLQLADRLAVIHEGRVVGLTERLEDLAGLTHPVIAELLQAVLPENPVFS